MLPSFIQSSSARSITFAKSAANLALYHILALPTKTRGDCDNVSEAREGIGFAFFPSLNVQIVRLSLGQSHLLVGMYCERSKFDVRRPDMYTCLQSLPTCSGSNSITVRRVHPFCNHAAFGFGVIDCPELPGLEMFHLEFAMNTG